jgi:hypothetical protein
MGTPGAVDEAVAIRERAHVLVDVEVMAGADQVTDFVRQTKARRRALMMHHGKCLVRIGKHTRSKAAAIRDQPQSVPPRRRDIFRAGDGFPPYSRRPCRQSARRGRSALPPPRSRSGRHALVACGSSRKLGSVARMSSGIGACSSGMRSSAINASRLPCA